MPIEIEQIEDPASLKIYAEEAPNNVPEHKPSKRQTIEVPQTAEFEINENENKNGFFI